MSLVIGTLKGSRPPRDGPRRRSRRLPTQVGSRAVPGAELATAVPMFGLSLLVFNDAIIKNRWPGVISGKLSDFAIVLYFPFLLTASWAVGSAAVRALYRTVTRRPVAPAPGLSRTRLLVGMAATTFALGAINVSTRARDLYLQLLDLLDVFDLMPTLGYTVDPTDLIGLTMLPLTWWWGNRIALSGSDSQQRLELSA